jgi:hypothetical protein
VKRDNRNGIIIALIITLVFMSVGYAYVSNGLDNSQLTTSVGSNYKNIKISTITSVETSGEAEDVKSMISADNELRLYPGLYTYGDQITYNVNISNEGNVDVELDSISVISDDSGINYSIGNLNAGDIIENNDSLMFSITLTRDDGFNELTNKVPEVIVKLGF